MSDTALQPTYDELAKEVLLLRQRVSHLEQQQAQSRYIEGALSQSEKRYRMLVEGLNDVVFAIDLEGRFTYVSPSLSRISKYAPIEFLGNLATNFIHPDDRERVLREVQETLAGHGRTREFRVLDKDERVLFVRTSSRLIRKRGRVVGLVGILTDITAQREAEAALQASEAHVRAVVESLPVPVIITRFSDTTIMSANRHVAQLFGAPLTDIVGQPARRFFHAQRDFRRLMVDVRRHGRVSDVIMRACQADGTPVWVSASIERIVFEGEEALVSGFYNLTDRKQAEEAQRQYTAELQTRNDELDAFAHTVAHDLKSPLSIVVGYTELLYEETVGQEHNYLGIIANTVHKIDSIIDELLLLAEVRKGRVELKPLPIGVIAREACSRLSHLAAAHVAQIHIATDWPPALGHGPWVEEIWINYVSNAIKYGGHPPVIELGSDRLTDDGQVRFWVKDNGAGLSAPQQAKLFTPFTQLAQVRATGHGLGLSIVRRIVEKLGGTVGVESTIGQGSTFYFTLPVVEVNE